MSDMNPNVNEFAGEARRRMAATADFGLNVFRPILHFQVMMLRMWADSIERMATNYEKGSKEAANTVKEQASRVA